MNDIQVSKYKDGMAVEHGEFMQLADMMKMMSPTGMDKPGMDHKVDSGRNNTATGKNK